jgi:hypothetical protein
MGNGLTKVWFTLPDGSISAARLSYYLQKQMAHAQR